jgi:hypothetical protein
MFHNTYCFVLSWHIVRMRLGVLSYRTLCLWSSPHHLHTDASGGTLASRVVTSCRSHGRRKIRGLTHPTADLFSFFDVITILCRGFGLLLLCMFVVMNLADYGLLSLCTFVVMNLCREFVCWSCLFVKLWICECVDWLVMCGLVVLICSTDCSG